MTRDGFAVALEMVKRPCWLPVLVGLTVCRPAFGWRVKVSILFPAKEITTFHVCLEVLSIVSGGGLGTGYGTGGIGGPTKYTQIFDEGDAVLERHTPGSPVAFVAPVI